MASANELKKRVRIQLEQSGDPQRASQQQAYMKSAIPFAGVPMPQVRRLAKQTLTDHPPLDKDSWLTTIAAIWEGARYREEKHVALEMLAINKLRKRWLEPGDLPLLKNLIVSGAWWDFVDPLSIQHVGYLLTHFNAEVQPHMYKWAEEDNLWVRRSAILCQLKFKGDTDTNLLQHAIQHSMSDNNFFARKAIGWALREYSKTHPDFVQHYIKTQGKNLSALSIREGSKYLG